MTSPIDSPIVILPGGPATIWFVLAAVPLGTAITWSLALNEFDPTRHRKLLAETFCTGIVGPVLAAILIHLTGANLWSNFFAQFMLAISVVAALCAGASWLNSFRPSAAPSQLLSKPFGHTQLRAWSSDSED